MRNFTVAKALDAFASAFVWSALAEQGKALSSSADQGLVAVFRLTLACSVAVDGIGLLLAAAAVYLLAVLLSREEDRSDDEDSDGSSGSSSSGSDSDTDDTDDSSGSSGSDEDDSGSSGSDGGGFSTPSSGRNSRSGKKKQASSVRRGKPTPALRRTKGGYSPFSGDDADDGYDLNDYDDTESWRGRGKGSIKGKRGSSSKKSRGIKGSDLSLARVEGIPVPDLEDGYDDYIYSFGGDGDGSDGEDEGFGAGRGLSYEYAISGRVPKQKQQHGRGSEGGPSSGRGRGGGDRGFGDVEMISSSTSGRPTGSMGFADPAYQRELRLSARAEQAPPYSPHSVPPLPSFGNTGGGGLSWEDPNAFGGYGGGGGEFVPAPPPVTEEDPGGYVRPKTQIPSMFFVPYPHLFVSQVLG